MNTYTPTDSSYYRALPHPHPAVEKYHFTMSDIHREGMTHGIAPPTLFGILIGRVLSNDVIDARLKKFIAPEDVDALRNDYNPMRNYQFVDTESGRNKYDVHQRYPAGMLKKGDALHTDDNRWMIVSDVERTNSQIKIFSGDAFVCSLLKHTMLTVAVSVSTANPYLGDIAKVKRDTNIQSTVQFFEQNNPGDFNYESLYDTIYDSI